MLLCRKWILNLTSFALGLTFIGAMVQSLANPMNFSEGYRMGVIGDCSRAGIYGARHLECNMTLGVQGGAWSKETPETHERKQMSPWFFSGDSDHFNRVSAMTGKLVVIQYEQRQVKWPNRDTDYEFIGLEQVHGALPTRDEMTAPAPFVGVNVKREGSKSGRIVKASARGNVVSTYEIIFQEGTGGNQYVEMSIRDKGLYEFAIECMKSGRMLNLRYQQARVKANLSDTDTVAYSISVVR